LTSSCPSRPPRPARRGRLLPAALILLGGLFLLLNPAAEARAQQPTPTPADITVTKSSEDETVPRGSVITYNIAVSNAGPGTAVNVVLTDAIPANTTYVSHELTAGNGSVEFDGTTLTVTFDSLAPPDPETGDVASGGVRLRVRVNADAPRGTVITNTVTGTADSHDPQTFVNSATANTLVTGPFAGDILISEFRLRGPGGATDEYIEIYNNADTPHRVQSVDDSAGYAVAASDGVVRCVIENGTDIPARGHILCVNEIGYSLGLYPAGDGEVPTATGDLFYTADIPDNAGLAVFNTSNAANFDLVHRLDAVGSTSVTNPVYVEGTGYPALSPLGLDYALYRDLCGKAGSPSTFGGCPTNGLPKDTNNNAVDFVFVSPDANTSGAGRRLGAPGPENAASPIQRNALFGVNLLDPCVGSTSPPNRVRVFTSDPTNNSLYGTIDIRRTVTNNTGQNVTRLRWRIIDISTLPAPSGVADLRARTSGPVTATVDRAPCGTGTSEVVVQGTTLEEPSFLPQLLGGGFNSSLTSGTITLATPLAPDASIDVRFLLGVQQTGLFKFFINIEALTREPEIIVPPDPEPEVSKPSPGAPLGPTVRPRKSVTALPSAPGAGTDAQPGAGAQPAPASPTTKQPAAKSTGGRRPAKAIARARLKRAF